MRVPYPAAITRKKHRVPITLKESSHDGISGDELSYTEKKNGRGDSLKKVKPFPGLRKQLLKQNVMQLQDIVDDMQEQVQAASQLIQELRQLVGHHLEVHHQKQPQQPESEPMKQELHPSSLPKEVTCGIEPVPFTPAAPIDVVNIPLDTSGASMDSIMEPISTSDASPPVYVDNLQPPVDGMWWLERTPMACSSEEGAVISGGSGRREYNTSVNHGHHQFFPNMTTDSYLYSSYQQPLRFQN